MASELDLAELHRAVRELAPNHLKPDERFIVWFMRVYFSLDAKTAEETLVGASGDKGMDAIFIDDQERLVHVIQGKYHQRVGNEERDRALGLAAIGPVLCRRARKDDVADLDGHVAIQEKLALMRERIRQRGYGLRLKLVTTSKVSEATARDAQAVLRNVNAEFDAFGARQLISLWHDFTQGAAPPVPRFRLQVRDKETFTFVDRHTHFESHLASVDVSSLARLYNDYGVRIFARNIRGYLSQPRSRESKSSKDINSQIRSTLREQPEYFWYYNNGVTMVADAAAATATYVDVTNPQVINGQQTTRVISETQRASGRSAVLVRVIVIPKVTPKQQRVFSQVINQIVKATNWQNKITLADLQTNDDEQIRIERALMELDYNYLRRRQSPSETLRLLRKKKRPRVVKEKLAQYIAACTADHVIAQAKNRLFDTDLYPKLFTAKRSAYEYLLFHWLGTATERVSRNDRTRRYAKWLVLSYLYHDLAFLRRAHYQERLVGLAERDRRFHEELRPLRELLESYFVLALDAYRTARRRDEDLDLATYFKRLSASADIARARRAHKNAAVAKRVTRLSVRLSKLLEQSLDRGA